VFRERLRIVSPEQVSERFLKGAAASAFVDAADRSPAQEVQQD